ncbi:hypothetical protein DVH05_007102 [Phytophthora capsici]|nr:hypothetical protein DVH05_012249 [Phytophthora capsici]KAG1686173.1 hypothetical protein DVH05_007102 [Phytophthora capsici]|eukprot:jgi/Phyca11/17014/fgenesh1_pg.PHYCAscaffold_24_\
MRLSFLLLAATFALLSSGTVASPTTNDEPISSPNTVLSSETEGRHLREHKNSIDDTEERGFNPAKFDRLMNERSYRQTRFGNWVDKPYTDMDVYKLLRVESNPNYRRIFHYYQNYLQEFAPHLITP